MLGIQKFREGRSGAYLMGGIGGMLPIRGGSGNFPRNVVQGGGGGVPANFANTKFLQSLRRHKNNAIYRILTFFIAYQLTNFPKKVIFSKKKYLPLMFINAKLLYNGAEGAVSEKFTVYLEYCPDFANFHVF